MRLLFCCAFLLLASGVRAEPWDDAAALARRSKFVQALPAAVKFKAERDEITLEGNSGLFLRPIKQYPDRNSVAAGLMELIGPALLATGSELWHLETEARPGRDYFQFMRAHIGFVRGIDVADAYLTVRTDDSSGEIQLVRARFLPDRSLPEGASITLERATELIRQAWQERAPPRYYIESYRHIAGRLAYVLLVPGDDWRSREIPVLVWQVGMPVDRCGERGGWVDAVDGTSVWLIRPTGMNVVAREPCTEFQ